MAMLGMPLLILNLGGEMIYILDQVRSPMLLSVDQATAALTRGAWCPSDAVATARAVCPPTAAEGPEYPRR